MTVMKILEQLWYETLHPAEILKPHDPKYNEFLDTADECEKKLSSLLTDEGKEIFRKLTESRTELNDMDNCEFFINGFHMGAKLMLEIINTDK